jgi:hypothetical protein
VRDKEIIDTELQLKDLEAVDAKLKKFEKAAKTGNDKDAVKTYSACSKLKETLELSSMEYINGLQSLRERYLIATTKTESIYFSLSPIFRKYISKFEGISSRNSCSEKLFSSTEQRRIGETPTATRHNIL